VDGSWHIEPYDRIVSQVAGDAQGDYFDVKVLRNYVDIEPDLDTDSSDSFFDQIDWPCLIAIIIFVVSIVGIIVFYFKTD
jgi:hypothetical protein